MNSEQRAYIEDNIELIENDKWEEFFQNAVQGVGAVLHTAGVPWMDEIDHIPAESFMSSDISEITIPQNITNIGSFAFVSCSNLTKVVIAKGVKTIGFQSFGSCKNLKSIMIPDSVTTIDGYAFAFCESLTNISIPHSVTYIGASAFDQCDLTSIELPEGIKVIQNKTFRACQNMEYAKLPVTVKQIYKNAFFNCINLKKIIYAGTTLQWSKVRCADKYVNACEIHCLDGVVKN